MKNQFFGDIRDYRKYGLFRILARGKKSSAAVCWMLTPDVGGPNGKRIEYLRRREKWRCFDPDLFDALHQAVVDDEERNVARAETPAILDPEVFSFYKETLKDDIDQRRDYFKKFLSRAEGRDLIFFDPDNGLEIKGVSSDRRGASKYLYFEEVSTTFNKRHSIVIFQFFMKIKAEDVISQKTSQIFSRLDIDEIASFKTPGVIFFLLPQPKYVDEMKERSEKARRAWPGQICPAWHSRTGNDSHIQRRSV
jgi:hypothetical protein